MKDVFSQAGPSDLVMLYFSGHGLLDLPSYDKFFAGSLHNYEYPKGAIAYALANLPIVD